MISTITNALINLLGNLQHEEGGMMGEGNENDRVVLASPELRKAPLGSANPYYIAVIKTHGGIKESHLNPGI